MNFSEFNRTIPVLLRNKIVPFIWGGQGIGKTQGVAQIKESMSLDGFVHLYTATQDVGDLIGLPDRKDGTTIYARPEWFPTSGTGILFLDELNHAPPEVLKALYALPTHGTIHRHKLPAGWHVIAAGNYQSNMFNVTDTSDAAWMSRFCHIDFEPTCQEFLAYAESTGAFSVADFIRRHPEMLKMPHKDRLDKGKISPDPRGWLDKIAALENEPEIENSRFEIYSGIVGNTAAASFLTDKAKNHDTLKGRDILNRYEFVADKVAEYCGQKSIRFDLLNAALEEVISIASEEKVLTENQVINFQTFLLNTPREFIMAAVKKIKQSEWAGKKLFLNREQFAAGIKKSKNQ